MKTLVLSTVCGVVLLAVSSAQAGHPIARARVANYRQTKAASRYAAAEAFRERAEDLKANADAVRASREQAVQDLQTSAVDLATRVRGARFALSVIGDIKGEHPLALDGIDGEHPNAFDGIDGERPQEMDGIDGEMPLPLFWWLYY